MLLLLLRALLECAIPTAREAESVRYQSDIVYRVIGRDTLRLDLVLPANGTPRGLLLITHGGGWRAGDKSERLAPSVRRIAAAGYAVASINYRLTAGATNRFPAALEDAGCAVAWLRRNQAVLGIDASRIVLVGESAGTQLAAMVALAPDVAGRACPDASLAQSIRGVIGMYGILDFLALADQPRALDAVTAHLGVAPSADTMLAKRASPIHHVAARPPEMLFVHGTADRSVSPDQSHRMARAVEAAGGRARVVLVPGQDHGFPMVSDDAALRESSCAILEFLAKHLAPEPNPVRVVATDYRLALPTAVEPGLRRIRLVNRGSEPHYLGLMRTDSGKTSRDYVAWRQSRTPRPAWLTPAGGIAPVQPGDSADLVLDLPAGQYVVFCTYPSSDGTSHLMKGMVGDLVVRGTDVRDEPVADAEVRLADFNFTVSAPLSAGRRTLSVRNESASLHQLLIVRLPDGVTEDQELAWFRGGSLGERPGIPTGGVLQLPAGQRVWASIALRPGRYMLLCTVVDREGRPHHALGMRATIAVPGDSTWRDHDRAARAARERRDWPAALRHAEILDSMVFGSPRVTLAIARAHANLRDTTRAAATLDRYARMGLTYDVRADSQLAWVAATPAFTPVRSRLAANGASRGMLRVAATMRQADFIGEGIAYDARRRRLLATSIRYGTVVAVGADGASRDFIDLKKDGGWAGLGLAIDSARGRLWISTMWYPHTNGVSAADSGKSSVFLYELATGKRVARYDLPRGAHEPGDLCVSRGGDLFVSDGRAGTISVVRAGADSMALLVPAGQLLSPQGCAVSDRGAGGRERVLVADYALGIASVDAVTGSVAWLPRSSFVAATGIDGMLLDGDRLIGVQNGVDPHRVVALHLDADHGSIGSVSVVAQDTARIHEPTHVAMMGSDVVFVANGGFGAWDAATGKQRAGATLRAPVLARVSLGGRDRTPVDSVRVQRELLALDAELSGATPLAFLDRMVADAPLLVPQHPILQATAAREVFDARYGKATGHAWKPQHAVTGSDGLFGCTVGVSRHRRADGAERIGSYVTCWQRARIGAPWRIVAHQRNEDQADTSARASIPRTLPASQIRAHDETGAEGALATDEAFARRAALAEGPGPAFAAFAAPDAVLLVPPGYPAGPGGIGTFFGGYLATRVLLWSPDRAYGGGSGGLAFTVGYSLARDRGASAGRQVGGKYISVWRRAPSGRWEYIIDQGTSLR